MSHESRGPAPLKPDVFAILLALTEGEAHGYALMKRARELSSAGGQLQPGALYRLLRRLLEDGLIEEVEAPEDDERRRPYRITAAGRRAAAAEARRMQSLIDVSRARRLLDDAGTA